MLGAVAVAALMAGCASVNTGSPSPAVRAEADDTPGASEYAEPASADEVLQFEPIPVDEVGAQDLQPVQTRPTSELLESARAAFEKANEAQQRGDEMEAYQQYTIMMETLLEADLDPTVFYNLRDEFSSILSTSTRIAKTFERTRPKAWSQDVVDMALRSELDYPSPLNERVQEEIKAIQTVYPKSFQAGLDRAARYLPYIRAEFQKAGLPEDLVWLAMVESQFTPRINSHAGASGMWQFMRSTGRRYGLRADYYLDERYDWKKATEAAVQYLSELYEIFDGSWPLAITAYNMGEAGLERAIASNGGERNLWRLIETPPASNRIRLESKRFYAKLLASAIVARDPERYGFTSAPEADEQTEYIMVKGAYSLRQIEEQAGLSRGTLARLNPQFLHGYTPPARTSYLSAPVDQNTRIAKVIDSMPELRPGTHTVQPGETLSEIAALYKVSIRELQSVNNIRSPRQLQINQRLVIPGGVSLDNGEMLVASSASGEQVYTVRRGDSLSEIAQRHRASVHDLQEWNNLGNRTRIHIGDRLIVSPAPPGTVVASAGSGSQELRYYTVSRGDYPEKIAHDYGVPLSNLLRWNGLSKRSTIYVGQKLKIYLPGRDTPSQTVTVASRTQGPARQHTVRKGENPSVIAKKYGIRTSDLLRWNDLTKRSVLHIGDALYVEDPSGSVVASTPTIQLADAGSDTGTVRMIHTVKRGENPSVIAQRYDVPLNSLFEWNGWDKAPLLHIGDEIVVFAPAGQ